MKHLKTLAAVTTLGVALFALSAPASAAPVFCAGESATLNYMSIDDSQVSACLLSGAGAGQAGNIGQAAQHDPFLNSAAGAGYTNVSADYVLSFNAGAGTWSFSASAWDDYAELAIGFKFGTGGHPDEWFVYSLQDLVSSGDFDFFNIGGTGGGLSHIVLYAGEERTVPEPGTLALLGLGLAGMGFATRRRRKA